MKETEKLSLIAGIITTIRGYVINDTVVMLLGLVIIIWYFSLRYIKEIIKKKEGQNHD